MPGVLRRSRQINTRRRTTAVVAGAAALAIATPTVLALPREHQQITVSAKPSKRTPAKSAGKSAGASSKAHAGKKIVHRIDLGSLPEGPAPRKVWYAQGVIHDGARALPFAPEGDVTEIGTTANGYALLDETSHLNDARIVLVGKDGTTTEVMRRSGIWAFRLSSDGRQIAWAARTDEAGEAIATTFYLASTETGKVVGKYASDIDLADVDGFMAGKVILTFNLGERLQAKLWGPRSNNISDWDGVTGLVALSGDERLAAVHTTKNRGDTNIPCSEIREDGRKLWDTCDLTGATFSPNGRRLAVLNIPIARVGSGQAQHTFKVYDTRTGRELLELRSSFPRAVWEDNDHLLLTLSKDEGTTDAIVRCTVTGECERTTPLVHNPDGGQSTLLDRRPSR